MRREDDGGAIRNLVQLLDETRAHGAQALDHVPVVHHLVAHVDGRAEQLDGALDDVDGAIDPGTEPARAGQEYLHSRCSGSCHVVVRLRRASSRDSRMISPAPMVMQLSATLNEGNS